jgi:hypothetical protein
MICVYGPVADCVLKINIVGERRQRSESSVSTGPTDRTSRELTLFAKAGKNGSRSPKLAARRNDVN